MFETLYFHIGGLKTGTTTIQATLADGMDHLAANGVHYVVRPLPILALVAAHPTHALRRLAKARTPSRHRAFLARSMASLRAAADSAAQPLGVLSSEEVLFLPAEDIARLADMLQSLATEVRVVYYARHPLGRIPSMMAQNIKLGLATSGDPLTRYVEGIEGELRPFLDAFGRDAFRVRPFDPAAWPNGCPVSDFLTTIGRPELRDTLVIHRRNDRLSAAAAEIADAVQAAGHRVHRNEIFKSFLTQIDGPPFTLSRDRLQGVRDAIEADLAYLDREFGLHPPPPVETPGPDRAAAFSDATLVSVWTAHMALAREAEALRGAKEAAERRVEVLHKKLSARRRRRRRRKRAE
ncbi:MAG: hypothetical protein AAGA32_08500 [Pseudomonadota bacterium]